MKIYEISQRLDLLEEAILFFWKQWGDESNFDFYKDSIVHSVNPEKEPAIMRNIIGSTLLQGITLTGSRRTFIVKRSEGNARP